MNKDLRTYRQILQETLETRCQKNPRYSLRSFARDLGLSAPRLSRVLNGHHGLSGKAARKLASQLNLSPAEQDLFCARVESEHARSVKNREAARRRALELSSAFESLGIDSFRLISDWYHFAILELTLVQDFVSEPVWVADQLGISLSEAKGGIERLLRMDLLELRDGRYRATGSYFANPEGTPSDAVRKFHTQILTRATQALELQTVQEREFSNLVIAIDERKLPLARQLIREFTQRMGTELGESPPPKSRVYNLSVQFFGLQKKQIKQ